MSLSGIIGNYFLWVRVTGVSWKKKVENVCRDWYTVGLVPGSSLGSGALQGLHPWLPRSRLQEHTAPEIRSERKSCRDSHQLHCHPSLSRVTVFCSLNEERRTQNQPAAGGWAGEGHIHNHSPGCSLVSQDMDRQLVAADAGVTLKPPLPQNICLLPDCPTAHGAAAHISWALAWEQRNGRVWQE